jgi:hypothetical protein
MKTNYSTYNPEKNKSNQLFSEASFYETLMRLIVLVVVTLLIVEVTQAQPLGIIYSNSKNPIGLNEKLNYTELAPHSKKKPVSAFILRKKGSLPSRQTLKPWEVSGLADSEDKAKAMVDAYFQGVYDADSNYKAKKSGKGLILITTLIGGPVAGIIPTVACSATAPKNNLNIPESKLVGDDSYMKGYKSEAHYIKKHNTWPCYVLASIVWIAAANIILR